MRLSQRISICYKLPHVTAYVTLHVTVKLLHFSMYFHMLPHVTATFYKKYIYFFYEKSLQINNQITACLSYLSIEEEALLSFAKITKIVYLVSRGCYYK